MAARNERASVARSRRMVSARGEKWRQRPACWYGACWPVVVRLESMVTPGGEAARRDATSNAAGSIGIWLATCITRLTRISIVACGPPAERMRRRACRRN